MTESLEQANHHLVIQSKKSLNVFYNTVRWVNKWSKRECFEDKPRGETDDRLSVLTNCARKSTEKRKAKQSPFEIRQETREADSRRLRQLFIYR